jgi:GC-rich sequence DNA-binding factor
LEQAGEKYIFIQKLRAYIVDICSMLAEKSSLIEELQDELQRAREERFTAYARRCGEVEAEERLPAEAAVAAAVSVLSSGTGGVKEATTAALQAAEKEEDNLLKGNHIPVDLDEFGRDSNVLRRSKVAKRILNRRQEKSNNLKNQEKPPEKQHYLGEITTSESEDELETYNRRKQEVLEASETVFRDAADEFGSLTAVKSRLEEWKEKYRGQYNDAYMAESVPAIFAPFVRQELLSWNPLDQATINTSGTSEGTATRLSTAPMDTGSGAANGSAIAARTPPTMHTYQGFDQQAWHKLLFNYGMPSDGTAPHPNDPDVDLVPKIVRALVLPIILATVGRTWRVQSTRQSKTVASMLAELMVYMDTENDALVKVVKATQGRLEEAVEQLAVPSWPPMALAATSRGEQYMERAFSRGLRLLQSVCAFYHVLPADKLQKLAVQQLTLVKLLPYIRAAIVNPEVLAERAGRLLNALPAAWMQGGLVRGLEGVVEVVQAAVRALEPAAGREESRTAKKSAANALAGVMERLGDAHGAHRLKLLFDVGA